MATLDLHGISTITAHHAGVPGNNWVKFCFAGKNNGFEITLFFGENERLAKDYATAINSVRAMQSVQVGGQEAA